MKAPRCGLDKPNPLSHRCEAVSAHAISMALSDEVVHLFWFQ